MSEKKTIMVLQAGPSQIRIIKLAQEMGLRVIATDRNKIAPGFQVADLGMDVDVIDKEGTLDLAMREGIDGILPGGDISQATAAYVSSKLGLPGLTPEQAEAVTNKELYLDLFVRNNIPYPETRVVTTLEECKDAVSHLGFPVLVKPTTSFGGSRGVKRINREEDITDAFSFAKVASRNGRVMVETFFDGEEHTVESMILNGRNHVLGISDKERIKDSYCLATSLNYPSQLPRDMIRKIEVIAQQTADAFRLKNWITHIEVITNGDDVKIIDFGARGGGAGYIPAVIIPNMTNINMMGEFIKMLVGEPSANVDIRMTGGIVYRFFTPPPGKVISIQGVDEVKSMNEVVDFHLYVKPGDVIPPVKTQLDRSGYFVVKARTFEDAMIAARKVEGTVSIITQNARG